MFIQRTVRWLVMAGVAAGILLGTACSDDASPDAGGAARADAGTPSTSYTVITTDNRFDVTTMTVPANEAVTVTVRNDGQALHNWRVLNVRDTAGKAIESSLLKGGGSESVTFTLPAAGRYSFRCDTHPAEMKGTLAVQ